MKRYRFNVLALAAVCSCLLFGHAQFAGAEIKLGILPRLGAVELFMMFNPLAGYLTREMGEKVSIVIPRDFEAFKRAARAGQIDIGFANSLVYVQLREDAQVEPLALSAEPLAGTRFRGIIIARKTSGINTLQDLKGKKLVFVEKDSAAGYLFQMLLLKKSGLDIHRDFILLPFAKKHDNVTMAVYNGAAQAGGIREDDLKKMKNKVDLSQIKIIGYTGYFPNWPMFAVASVAREKAAKIRTALLRLKPNDPRSRQILGPANISGFAPVSDKDYDPVREAIRLVGTP